MQRLNVFRIVLIDSAQKINYFLLKTNYREY